MYPDSERQEYAREHQSGAPRRFFGYIKEYNKERKKGAINCADAVEKFGEEPLLSHKERKKGCPYPHIEDNPCSTLYSFYVIKLEDKYTGKFRPHVREMTVATQCEIAESNYLKGNLGPLNLRCA